jgi:type III pantothenate kinase
MPGLGMMQKSLFENAAGINVQTGNFAPLADNTADAVYSGCLQLVAEGLSQLVHRHGEALNDELQCVISGGDGEMVARHMKCECVYRADLVLRGLGLVSD